jgi:hypothetical protein
MAATAAVETTTTATVESTTAHATAMEASAAHVAVEAATCEAASNRTAAITATVRYSVSITVTGSSIPIASVSIIPAAVAIVATVAVATVPGAGPDEDAAAKPRRTIVPIGRAGVGIVAVITIGANGGRITISPVHRATDPYSHGNLSMGNRCGREQQDTQYSEIA